MTGPNISSLIVTYFGSSVKITVGSTKYPTDLSALPPAIILQLESFLAFSM